MDFTLNLMDFKDFHMKMLTSLFTFSFLENAFSPILLLQACVMPWIFQTFEIKFNTERFLESR